MTISFAGTIDGTAVRRRFGRRRRCDDRIEHVHSGLRGSAHRHHGGREPHAEGDFSAALHEAANSPAKMPSSWSPRSPSKRPGTVTTDDAFAKSLGLELLAKLRDAVKDSIAREHTAMSRQKLKRGLLDDLDKLHKFEPPPTLVEEEFDRVWKSVCPNWKPSTRPSPTRAPPRKRPRRNTARSPSAGSARAGACRNRREEQHHA